MEPGNGGEPVAFERGTVDAGGHEVVEQGEEVLSHEMLLDDAATLSRFRRPVPASRGHAIDPERRRRLR
jgi:hypothetical protein